MFGRKACVNIKVVLKRIHSLMTVSYTYEVADCRGFGCFLKLLLRWKASIYKLLWQEACLFFSLYFSISLIYRFVLSDPQKRTFELVAIQMKSYVNYFPISFVIGFFVTVVVYRWWETISKIPWPDGLALLLYTYIIAEDERAKRLRRTIIRYVNLSLVLALRDVNPVVKMRFPNYSYLVRAKILEESELKLLERVKMKHPVFFLPLIWSCQLVKESRLDGYLDHDLQHDHIIQELEKFRRSLRTLYVYDWFSIPLVYTQVVTGIVFLFFFLCLVTEQYLDPAQGYPNHRIDLYFPFFSSFQLFFYLGWLKVAETLINPLGDDDDDFEANLIIDRNFTVGFFVVSRMRALAPPIACNLAWENQSAAQDGTSRK